ncbi:MAG: extracellular solute-binding protein, partial [Actinomycetota bacterium]|nr:extracellular solute-binding protein [Actinomycetota bacterium]
ACAGPGSRSGGAPAAAPTGGAATGGISFAHWRAEDKAVFDGILGTFTGANPGVTVRQDISPSNDYATTALQRLRGGQVGDAFAAFPGAQFTNISSAGLFSDLSNAAYKANYDSRYLDAGASGGKQLALPYHVVFNMPVTNEDLLDRAGAAGVPENWADFLDLCDKLKGAGVAPIAWPGGEPGNAGQLWNSMVMNNAPSPDVGAKIESGDFSCTDDWYLKTLDQYAQLRPFFQPNATGTAVEPAQQIFAQGKAGMLATGSYHVAAVRALGARFPLGLLSPITVDEGDEAEYEGVFNQTFMLAVNSASAKQQAAAKLVEHLSSPQVASVYANGTSQHLTVKDVDYTNADLKALAPWLQRKTARAPRVGFLDLDIRNAVENAAVRVVGGAAPEQAAEEAQRVVDQKRPKS